MESAVISEKGTRSVMEDAHILDKNFGSQGWIYGGIYDGHNGAYAAEHAAKRLHEIFLEKILAGVAPGPAFSQSYETISEELGGQESGTTAVDFLIQGKTIHVANAGDARAIIVSRERISQLTVDHRVDNPEERKRVVKMGAAIDYPYVVKGDQGLMPTRTIGDRYFKTVGVIATPSLKEYAIGSDDLMLVLACDGLWDFMSNSEVAAMVFEHPVPKLLLGALTREVLVNRSGTDNLTVMAVSLSGEIPGNKPAGLSRRQT
jgi:serine/threonine protein phosphatase PrpC